MARASRIHFAPNMTAQDQPPVRVSGAELRISRFGDGESQGAEAPPKPAVLSFSGAYIIKARTVSEPEFTPFAELSGQFELVGTAEVPVFICAPEAAFVYTEPAPEDEAATRHLALSYHPKSFRTPPPNIAPAARLRLPKEAPDPEGPARFFELAIQLSVDGSVEAAVETNDRLDVPLHPITTRLIVEWPDDYTEDLPNPVLVTARTESRTATLNWHSAPIRDDHRQLVFHRMPEGEVVTLTATGGGKTIVLWNAQLASDPEVEPIWEHTLEELFVEPEEEDDEGEEIDQTQHIVTEAEGLDTFQGRN